MLVMNPTLPKWLGEARYHFVVSLGSCSCCRGAGADSVSVVDCSADVASAGVLWLVVAVCAAVALLVTVSYREVDTKHMREHRTIKRVKEPIISVYLVAPGGYSHSAAGLLFQFYALKSTHTTSAVSSLPIANRPRVQTNKTLTCSVFRRSMTSM